MKYQGIWKIALVSLICVVIPVVLTTKTQSLESSNQRFQLDEPYNPNFFFDGISEDCLNFCWYNLTIGESSLSDFKIFLDSQESDNNTQRDDSVEDTPYQGWKISKTYQIDAPPDNAIIDGAYITISGYGQHNILQGIRLGFGDLSVLDVSPRKMIEAFGQPTGVYIAASNIYKTIRLWMVYSTQNLYINYSIPNIEEDISQVCLFPEMWITDFTTTWITIADAATPNIEEVTFEKEWFYDKRIPIEDATGLTREDFSNLILEEEKPCIEVKDTALVD